MSEEKRKLSKARLVSEGLMVASLVLASRVRQRRSAVLGKSSPGDCRARAPGLGKAHLGLVDARAGEGDHEELKSGRRPLASATGPGAAAQSG